MNSTPVNGTTNEAAPSTTANPTARQETPKKPSLIIFMLSQMEA